MVRLNDAGFLQSPECAVFLNGAQAAGGESDDHRLLEFGDVNALFLQVRIPTDGAAGIELGGAGAVGIPSPGHRSSLGYCADSGHGIYMRFVW